MKTKRFLICWFSASIIMYALSYLWHGILLNDYSNIRFPLWLYFTLAAIVYLIIGLVLTYLYRFTRTRELKYKGAMMGMSLGFFIYLIAFVLGVSFNQHTASHIVVDFIWQMFEQGVGGAAVGSIMSFLLATERLDRTQG